MDSQRIASLSHPESLRIGSDTEPIFGCNQAWFTEGWQRRAGCGPCTAATMLLYLSHRDPILKCLYPPGNTSRENFTGFMADIWRFVTPGAAGVNEARILIDGISRYSAACNITLEPRLYDVPHKLRRHKPVEGFLSFVRDGLASDSPVALLNRSNGRLTNLDSWHWVTITGLSLPEEGREPPLGGSLKPGHAVISDSGDRKVIDLAGWYASSWLGGAAVWFDVLET